MSTLVVCSFRGTVTSSGSGRQPCETSVVTLAISRKCASFTTPTHNNTDHMCRYWNWPLWSENLKASPLFDCSDSSLSGDGNYNPDEQSLSGGAVTIPRGSGGGCVRCGPFKDMEIHMGPFDRNIVSFDKLPAPGFDYNPRCFNRSLNNFVSSNYDNETIVDRLLSATNISDFQTVMDYWPARPGGVLGVHGGGHFSLGATLQDLFTSPQDPAFMLHHSMIDRLWSMWQAKDEDRRFALNGTNRLSNPPDAPLVTVDMEMEFGAVSYTHLTLPTICSV